MEDDGGASVTTPVQAELKHSQLKVISHLNRAYGLKVQKVNLNLTLSLNFLVKIVIQNVVSNLIHFEGKLVNFFSQKRGAKRRKC